MKERLSAISQFNHDYHYSEKKVNQWHNYTQTHITYLQSQSQMAVTPRVSDMSTPGLRVPRDTDDVSTQSQGGRHHGPRRPVSSV